MFNESNRFLADVVVGCLNGVVLGLHGGLDASYLLLYVIELLVKIKGF